MMKRQEKIFKNVTRKRLKKFVDYLYDLKDDGYLTNYIWTPYKKDKKRGELTIEIYGKKKIRKKIIKTAKKMFK